MNLKRARSDRPAAASMPQPSDARSALWRSVVGMLVPAAGLCSALILAGFAASQVIKALDPPAAAFDRAHAKWRATLDLAQLPAAELRAAAAFFGPEPEALAPVAVREGRLVSDLFPRAGLTHLACLRRATYADEPAPGPRYVVVNGSRWLVPASLQELKGMTSTDYVELRDGKWRLRRSGVDSAAGAAPDVGACAWLAWNVAVANDLGFAADLHSSVLLQPSGQALREIVGPEHFDR